MQVRKSGKMRKIPAFALKSDYLMWVEVIAEGKRSNGLNPDDTFSVIP